MKIIQYEIVQYGIRGIRFPRSKKCKRKTNKNDITMIAISKSSFRIHKRLFLNAASISSFTLKESRISWATHWYQRRIFKQKLDETPLLKIM